MVNPAFLYKGFPPPALLLAGYVATTAALVARGRQWGWVFLWPAVLYLLVSYSYLRDGTLGTRLIGKRLDTGSIPPWRAAVFLPFLLTCWVVWWLRHVLLLFREDGFNTVAPGLYLGRYPLWLPRCRSAQHFPKDGGVAVVDMCAEFPALPWIVRQAAGKYVCLPCLDGDMPEDRWALLRAARQVAAWAGSQPVYVHCANGRGRSLCFAALVLVLRGGGPKTAEKAIACIREKRPQVKAQQRQIDIVAEVLRLHERGDIQLSARNTAAELEPPKPLGSSSAPDGEAIEQPGAVP